jgi:ribosomal protein S6
MATDETKEYEIAFLVRDEKEAEEVLGIIARFGAEAVFHGPVEKISLAYPIKKETSAYFGYFHFALDPQKIASLAYELRMNPAIIRFLIVSPPFVKIKAKIIQKTKRAPQPAVERKIEPLPLSNEALEKKIEEILQE